MRRAVLASVVLLVVAVGQTTRPGAPVRPAVSAGVSEEAVEKLVTYVQGVARTNVNTGTIAERDALNRADAALCAAAMKDLLDSAPGAIDFVVDRVEPNPKNVAPGGPARNEVLNTEVYVVDKAKMDEYLKQKYLVVAHLEWKPPLVYSDLQKEELAALSGTRGGRRSGMGGATRTREQVEESARKSLPTQHMVIRTNNAGVLQWKAGSHQTMTVYCAEVISLFSNETVSLAKYKVDVSGKKMPETDTSATYDNLSLHVIEAAGAGP